AKNQHYFLSQAGDISLRTMGAGKRAVIQADKGFVNLNAGKTASVSGGGVSIGAAEELELEDVVYGGEWESTKHKSAAPGAGRTALAAGAALASLHDLIIHKKRPKFDPGNFAPLAKEELGDRAKWLTNSLAFIFAAKKVYSLVSEPAAPEKCVKLHAQKNLAAIAGNDLGFFGRMGASLGAAVWTTVSAGVTVSLKALGLGGVGGTFVALKGFRKCEIGSDWGKTFVGAEKEISVTAGAELTVSAKQTAHVAAFGDKGLALFGGTEQVWLGTKAGQGWGLLCNDEGLAVGEASNAAEMKKAKIKPKKASIRVEKDKIVLRGGHKPTITFSSGNCTVASPQIRFVAKSGQCTVNGAGMILLK
ncbi:MAG: hypothetical protein IT373_38450, partial [Polyangiaceae bacterium]|nr:hypothetical protein [Polyangiaceae bacterium]